MASASFRLIGRNKSFQKWLVAATVATPTVAILQGTLYLTDYRTNYRDAPSPVSPARGVVVVSPQDLEDSSDSSSLSSTSPKASSSSSNNASESWNLPRLKRVENESKQHMTTTEGAAAPAVTRTAGAGAGAADTATSNHQRPIRLLVIGDSLAAGIGISKSSTPILPESIARELSKALGGRPVYWTCHGSPGASASRIVHDIESFQPDDDDDDTYEDVDHHHDTKEMERHDGIKHDIGKVRKVREWLFQGKRRFVVQNYDRSPHNSNNNNNNNNNRHEKENDDHQQSGNGLNNDINDKSNNENRIDCSGDDTHEKEECEQHVWKRWRDRLWNHNKSKSSHHHHHHHRHHHNNNSKRENYDQYDVAIVLTGLNDLKGIILPFMMTDDQIQHAQRSPNEDGFKGELLRVLNALSKKMNLNINGGNSLLRRFTTSQANNDNNDESMHRDNDHDRMVSSSKSHENHLPLVVLPALPAQAVPIFQLPPLSWFALWLIRLLDDHKRVVSEAYPGKVLYVEAPTVSAIAEFEAGKGSLWTHRRTENVLLALTDVKSRVRAKIEELMHKYYMEKRGPNTSISRDQVANQMVQDREDDTNDDGNHENHHDQCERHYEQSYYHHPLATSSKLPGSKLIAADNIHPNDEGYDFWGRHIAAAIVREWKI